MRLPSALLAVGVGLLVAYLPGLAILNRFSALRRIDALSRLFIAPGVSAALYVVLFALCFKLNIKLGGGTPWLICIVAAGSLLYPLPRLRIPKPRWTSGAIAYIVLAVVSAVVMASRLLAINGLVAPLWGDSVHHTIIVQLLIENGGLFQSWQPYADVTTFTYHFGFHAITTLYAWMRGMSAEFSVLMMGQIANFAAVMGLYALARLWTKSPWGGMAAVIIGGLISTNPYYFLYWGRYTQLTGQIILITALVLMTAYLSSPRRRENIAYLIVLPLVIAGVGMAQYKVGVIFVALCLPLVLFSAIRGYLRRRDVRYALVASIGRALVIAGVAVLLFMARGWDIVPGTLGSSVQLRVSTEIDLAAPVANQQTPLLVRLGQAGFETDALPIWLLGFCGVCILAVKRRDGLWFVAGMGACLITMDPRLIGIKRLGFVDEFHLSITSYIAAAGLGGLAVGTLVDVIEHRWPKSRVAAGLVCLAVCGFGATHLPPLPPGSIFVLPDDIQMMTWIRENVPAGEHIAAPGFIAYKSFTVGRDAGWWIPFYTGHRTNLMFMAAGQEQTNATRAKVNEVAFTQELYARDMSQPDSADWLASHGYRYFLIGAKPLTWKEGDGSADHTTLVDQLLRNPAFKVVHQSGEARLLEVARQ